MTLIELLVVLVIMGLLAVTVAPVLVGNRDKKTLREAGDTAESLVSHVAAKALSAPTGAAAWLQAEQSGAGSGFAVIELGFARVPIAATGTTTITSPSVGPSGSTAVVSLSLSSNLANDLPAPIEFAGIPGTFTATAVSAITSANTSVSGVVNRTFHNSPIPATRSSAVPYTLHLPPRPSSSTSSAALRGGSCIDLTSSTIGIVGYSSAVTLLSGYRRIAITFDRTGCPSAVWMSTAYSGGSWSRQVLTASMPIVLAVGSRSQIAEAWVATPDDDNPGRTWQNPYARWILIDPRSGAARVLEVGSSRGNSSESLALRNALAPVAEAFLNVPVTNP